MGSKKQLKLFNSQTQTVELFNPPDPMDVRIYCCGPTVYDVPHLGHARTYIFFDVLRRILCHYMGYGVRTVMNITDLDDKILDKGGVKITPCFEKMFFETMKWLNVDRPDFTPRVSQALKITYDLSKDCLIQKAAYYTVHFESTLFCTNHYLEKFDRTFPQTKARDDACDWDPEEVEDSILTLQDDTKWDPRDFAVWKHNKKWTDADGNTHIGMPGWHTECAAIAHFYFPEYMDILLGGIDLQFPHHENTLALDRVCHFRKPDENWARFCLHTGHLHMEGKKMSKSLKNFTTIDEMVAGGYSPLAIRYMFLKHPYYKPMQFQKAEMDQAQKSYDQLMRNLQKIQVLLSEAEKKDQNKHLCDWYSHHDEFGMVHLTDFKRTIHHHFMENLNVPKVLEEVEFRVKKMTSTNIEYYPLEWLAYNYNYIVWLMDTCLGLIPTESTEELKDMYLTLKKFRERVREWAMRENKDKSKADLLELCDNVRDEVNEMGYVIEDSQKVEL